MEKTGWKVLAIIFMIIFILQVAFVIWAFNIGTEMVEKENECAYNTCGLYETYYYDDYEKLCYCYNDNEIAYQEYLK